MIAMLVHQCDYLGCTDPAEWFNPFVGVWGCETHKKLSDDALAEHCKDPQGCQGNHDLMGRWLPAEAVGEEAAEVRPLLLEVAKLIFARIMQDGSPPPIVPQRKEYDH